LVTLFFSDIFQLDISVLNILKKFCCGLSAANY